MTKRWFSMIVVLALLLSCFTGVAAEAPIAKGVNPLVTFEPVGEIIATKKTQAFTAKLLGTFMVDGKATLTPTQASDILGNLDMTNASSLYLGTNGQLTGSFTGPASTSNVVVSFTMTDTTDNSTKGLDFTKFASVTTTAATVKLNYPVTQVKLDKTRLTFTGVSTTAQSLAATITPSDALNGDLEWTLAAGGDKIVALSATTGSPVSVTSLDAGTTVITASTKNGKKASCTVTVSPVAVESFTLAIGSAGAIYVGNTTKVTPTITAPANATSTTYTYLSGNPAVASVDAEGVVTGLSNGTATIYATSTNGKQATASVTVSTQTTKTVLAPEFSVATGTAIHETTELKLTCNTVGASIYYTKQKGSAPVDPDPDSGVGALYTGPITLEEVGGWHFKAIAVKDDYANSSVASANYDVDVYPTDATISQETAAMAGIAELELTAKVVPALANVGTVVWASSDPTVADVDQKGVVKSTGVAGTATISATFTSVTAGSAKEAVAECEITVTTVPLTGIALGEASISVPEGQKTTVTATATPDNASTPALTVTSQDTAIATAVWDAGVITVEGKDEGKTQIFVDAGSFRKILSVEVTKAEEACAAPVFDPAATTFTETGKTVKIISMDAKPSVEVHYTKDGSVPTAASTLYATGTAISLDDNKTTILKAIAVDTTVGVGKLKDSPVTTAIFVSEVAVTGVDLNTPTATIQGTSTTQLQAIVAPTQAKNKNVTWTSSDEAVVKVDKDGLVTGVAMGKATITVTTEDGAFTDTCEVTVTKVAVSSISLASASPMMVGNTQKMAVTFDPTYATNKKVTWQSSDTTVATVDADGVVTAIKASTSPVIITATSDDGKKPATATIASIAADDGTIAAIDWTIKLADGTNAPAVLTDLAQAVNVKLATDTAGVNFYYTTNNDVPSASSTAYDDAKGIDIAEDCTLKVVAMKTGKQPVYDSKTFTFKIRVSKVELDKTLETVAKGKTLQLTATVTPDAAKEKGVTWSTTDDTIATVSETGLVTGVKNGTVTIRATSKDVTTVYGECIVIVEDAAVESVTVLPATLAMSIGDSQTLGVKILPAGALQTATWTSSAPAVVTVGKTSGAITAQAAGTATITATVGGKTGTCLITVAADPVEPAHKPEEVPNFEPETSFSAIEHDALTKVIGKFEPKGTDKWEEIAYYYNVVFTPGVGMPAGSLFATDNQGNVTLSIPDVGATSIDSFSYSWVLKWKTNRGAVPATSLNDSGRTVSGNSLTITAIPADFIITPATVPDTSSESGKPVSLVFGSMDNFSDFKAAGIEPTVVIDSEKTGDVTEKATADGIKASGIIADNGSIVVTVEGTKKGIYKITATVKATGYTDAVVGSANVTITTDAEKNYKIIVGGTTLSTESAGTIYVPFVKKGTFQLALNEGAGSGWAIAKAGKKKTIATISSTGLVTMKKKAGAFTVTAVNEKGETVTQLFSTKIAKTLKVQKRNAKDTKWVAVSKLAKKGLPVVLGAPQKIRVLAKAPSKAPVLGLTWASSDETIFTVVGDATGAAVVTPVALGSATLTATTFNNVSLTFTVNVVATAVAEDEEPEVEVKVGKVTIAKK